MREILDFQYMDQGKDPLSNLRHSHSGSYEILYVRAGSGSVVIRDRLLTLQAGAVYFINGMDTHCTVPDDPAVYTRSKILLSAAFLARACRALDCQGLLEELFDRGGTCFLPSRVDAAYIDANFLSLDRLLQQGEGGYSAAGVAASVLAILVTGYKKRERAVPRGDTRISDVLSYIDQNLAERLTLSDICKNGHISKYYLCHEFKKKVGMSVFDYIISRRLTQAQRYLLEGDMQISEIADAVGFSSLAYFSKVFREHEGVSPGQFRKERQ